MGRSIPCRLLPRPLVACVLVCLFCNPVFTAWSAAEATESNGPQLVALFDRLDAVDRQVPRDSFDPHAIVEIAGRNPDKLLSWVAANTIELPYCGALRGAAGVLMDRAGNSFDRALLLAEMLQSTGLEVRLANAALSNDEAHDQLQQIIKLSSPSPELQVSAEAAQMRERIRKEVDELLKLVVDPPSNDPSSEAEMTEALKDHWWVQRRDGQKWIDLDVSGISKRAPSRTIAFAGARSNLPLDARDFHEVQVRIIVEAWKSGKLVTEPVLTQSFRPIETLGRSIMFTHFMGRAVTPPLDGDAASAKAFKNAILRQETFVPTFLVDSRPIHSAAFTTFGEIDRHPQTDPQGKLAGSAGRATGQSIGALSGRVGDAKKEGVLTAEWIEYEIRVPGRPPQRTLREVFDLIGPAQRSAGQKTAPMVSDEARLTRALALTGRTQILIQSCDLSQEFLAHLSARSHIRDRALWTNLERGGASDQRSISKAANKFLSRDTVTPAIAMARVSLDVGALRSFIDQPNVVQYRRKLQVGPDGGLIVSRSVDLTATSTSAIATGTAAFRARLGKGVADTWAEYLSLGPDSEAVENTAAGFELAAASAKQPGIFIPGRASPALAALKMPTDAMSRAASDLAAGNILVMRNNGDRWCWWRVDARTGHTVGVMDNGFNAATAEEILDQDIAAFGEELGEPITRESLKRASGETLKRWASKAKSVEPWRMLADLEQMQGELVGREMQLLIRGSFRG